MTTEDIQLTADALKIAPEEVQALAAAAAPLWRELDRLGWTDAHGGAEFGRVFPIALATIRDEANTIPGLPSPGWAGRVEEAQSQLV